MRLLVALAVLTVSCFSFVSSSIADTYCRLYKTMTMGDNVACYYCLKCSPPCDGPAKGSLGTWNDTTGSCGSCLGSHCFDFQRSDAPAPTPAAPPNGVDQRAAAPVRAAAAAAAPKSLKAKKLTAPPSVLLDPDHTKDKKNWYVSLKVSVDGEEKIVKVFVVTATVRAPGTKPNGQPFPAAKLGFGREIETTFETHGHIDDPEPTLEPGQYRFKFKGHDCVAIIEMP
jgi:hypothetical protein